ncbi:MAG: acyl-CoA thioesterase, partial [Verrucomicrobiae bacterium]|nr:acyl-CoA thioesterase [Verrucomicrobiae bacterium]
PLHRHRCVVAFGDTDASGWMHFPNAFRDAEAAEHEFLRSRGVLVFDRAEGGWPRVKAGAEFKRPLLPGDSIEVLLRISRIGGASVTWEFEILNPGGEPAVSGTMTSVRVNAAGRPQVLSQEERDALG